MTNEEAHELSRKRGTSRLIYGTARVVLTPIAGVWYRFKVTGAEYVPKDGPAIIAPNHKSFYDSFFIGLATRRHLHFMAKTELFEGKSARILSGLGAFPVRRGEADPDALETARLHLERGRVLALFPEGTRHRDPEQLRSPHKGAGRLAIEARRRAWRSGTTRRRRRSSPARSPAPTACSTAGSRARSRSRSRSRPRSSPLSSRPRPRPPPT